MERSEIREHPVRCDTVPDCAALHPGHEAPPTRPPSDRAGIRRGRRNAELGFQGSDPALESLVLLTREAGHVLDRVELLALDEVEVAQDAFGLVAHDRIDLALDALRGTGGVVHQAADLVEKPIAGLGHLKRSGRCKLIVTDMTMAIPRGRFKSKVQERDSRPTRCPLPCHAPVSLQSYQALNQKPESQRKKNRP